MMRSTRSNLVIGALGAAAAVGLGTALLRKGRSDFFRGRVVLITGGSRGLGLVLARELAAEGARLALLARNEHELALACNDLGRRGAEVIGIPCDVRDQADVEDAVALAADTFGRLDIVINNAGIIQFGPLEHMSFDDFDDAMATHFYGPLFVTAAALPWLEESGDGRLVNIASIGGRIAIPHMAPYCASKFALVGLSDALGIELRQRGIRVTTVCPGLMRTGSPPNAFFKGRHSAEYAWFALAGAMPLLSLDALRAARKILSAVRRGSPRITVGAPAKAVALFDALLPAPRALMMDLTTRLLPQPTDDPAGDRRRTGWQSESRLAPSFLTRLSDKATLRNNELVAARY